MLLASGCRSESPESDDTSSGTRETAPASSPPTPDRPDTARTVVVASPEATPLERAIVRQLESADVAPTSDFAAPVDGVYLCSTKTYGRGDDVVYARVLCGVYATGEEARMLSGSLLDVALTVTGRGAATRVDRVDTPRQSAVEADRRRLFPDAVLAAMDRDASCVDECLRPTAGEIVRALRAAR